MERVPAVIGRQTWFSCQTPDARCQTDNSPALRHSLELINQVANLGDSKPQAEQCFLLCCSQTAPRTMTSFASGQCVVQEYRC